MDSTQGVQEMAWCKVDVHAVTNNDTPHSPATGTGREISVHAAWHN